EGVAVHGVADPGDLEPGGRDLLDQGRQVLGDPAGTHARDEGEATGAVLRVELGRDGDQVVGRGPRTDLDADRVVHAAEHLDVRAVEVVGAFADPDEVA